MLGRSPRATTRVGKMSTHLRYVALLFLLVGFANTCFADSVANGTFTQAGRVESDGQRITFEKPFQTVPRLIFSHLTFGRSLSCRPYAANLTNTSFVYKSNCDSGYTGYSTGAWIAAQSGILGATSAFATMTEIGSVSNNGAHVSFSPPFPGIPEVTLTLSNFGSVSCHPSAANISSGGFDYHSNCTSGWTNYVQSSWIAVLHQPAQSPINNFHASQTEIGSVEHDGDHVKFESSFPSIPKVVFTRHSMGSGVLCNPSAANLTASGFDYHSNCSGGYTAIVYSGWIANSLN
jgi:hypothetical protein